MRPSSDGGASIAKEVGFALAVLNELLKRDTRTPVRCFFVRRRFGHGVTNKINGFSDGRYFKSVITSAPRPPPNLEGKTCSSDLLRLKLMGSVMEGISNR